jgi:hypothetical protein
VLKIMRRRGMLAMEYWTRRKEHRDVQVGMTEMEAATDEHDARAMRVRASRRSVWVGQDGQSKGCGRAGEVCVCSAVMTVERGASPCPIVQHCFDRHNEWSGLDSAVAPFSGGSTTVSTSYASSLPVVA